MCARDEGRSHALSWTVDRQHGLKTVRLSGELDLASANDLTEALTELTTDGSVVVVDLHGLEFMDSTGLKVFARFKQKADNDGHRFLLGRPSHPVRRVLHVSGLAEYFDYVEGTPGDEILCTVCDSWFPAGNARCIHCGAEV